MKFEPERTEYWSDDDDNTKKPEPATTENWSEVVIPNKEPEAATTEDWSDDDNNDEWDEHVKAIWIDPGRKRDPEPGDLDYEMGQALKVHPDVVEHMSAGQVRARMFELEERREMDRLEQLSLEDRRQEIEQMSKEIKGLASTVQSAMARAQNLIRRCATLIKPYE